MHKDTHAHTHTGLITGASGCPEEQVLRRRACMCVRWSHCVWSLCVSGCVKGNHCVCVSVCVCVLHKIGELQICCGLSVCVWLWARMHACVLLRDFGVWLVIDFPICADHSSMAELDTAQVSFLLASTTNAWLLRPLTVAEIKKHECHSKCGVLKDIWYANQIENYDANLSKSPTSGPNLTWSAAKLSWLLKALLHISKSRYMP